MRWKATEYEIVERRNIVNSLREDGILCDAEIAVENKTLPVHRAILAAESPYFRQMFTNDQMLRKTFVRIHIPFIDPYTLELAVCFMYTRTLPKTESNLWKLLPLADVLQMKGLSELCCLRLSKLLTAVNAVNYWQCAVCFGSDHLVGMARTFVLNNFSQVITYNKDFNDIDISWLTGLIQDDFLNVRTEEEVFETVIKWIGQRSDRITHMPVLLNLIRLGHIHPEYFLENVSSHPHIKDNPLCENTVSNAWDFLYALDRFGPNNLTLSNPIVRPRIPREVIFAVGGWSGGNPISFFETYDARSDRWYTHTVMEENSPRAYHGMVAVGRSIFVLGGFDGTQYYNTVRYFDPLRQTWQEVAPMYHKRCYVAAVAMDTHIYACGGYDGRWRLRSVERYDVIYNQWVKCADMLTRRSDASADCLHGLIYIGGGFDGDRCLRLVESYNPHTNQWTAVQAFSIPRSGVCLAAYHNSLYALGGFDGESRLASVERYCPTMDTWSTVPDMAAARSNFATCVMDDMIFVIGGFNGSYTIAHVECYDEVTNEWYDATDMNINRSALRACVLRDLPNVKVYTHYGHTSQDEEGKSSDKAHT